jgi:hypothetical protein
MEIRKDFASASVILERLLLYSNVYWENNREQWPHMKHREDFKQVYEIEDAVIRQKLERIYSVGRDFAVYMSYKLVAFNEPAEHPTLTSYIKSFDDEWFVKVDFFEGILNDALEAKSQIKYCPWAIDRMIEIFERQLELRQHVADTLILLKNTDIYKIESGEPIMKNGETHIRHEYNISGVSNSALNINSPAAKASVQHLGEIKETISQLSDIFQKAQFADKIYQEQSLELLDSILDETHKLQPKKLSVASMVSTLSSLASLATSMDKNVPVLLEKIKHLIQ